MASPDFWERGSIHGDEYYTRREDAETIADHIIKIPLKVWLPFNDADSAWFHVLKERGFDVVVTDGDFFTTEPPSGVQCFDCGYTVDKGNQVQHDAQVAWNRGDAGG